ncbi:hypothetical protein [Pseudooceanicola sp. HF7]|uniref:hypothetical protein n=1 Tax=Pseudooceanicola sp. HF7 TaxID=2721560 RepID=UPI001589E185|nr:hypothetical protein [Pseudooceanicola sp. HF7]
MPGIIAASATAAALGQSLTERDETDTFVVTTGTCRSGSCAPLQTGDLHCLFMAVEKAVQVQADGYCGVSQHRPATKGIDYARRLVRNGCGSGNQRPGHSHVAIPQVVGPRSSLL